MLRVIAGLGYERERADKVWALDLRAHGARLCDEAKTARTRLAAAGIKLVTLAQWDDPQRFEKLHALNDLTRLDIPHRTPILPMNLDDFMARATSPARKHDRWWIALDGSEAVAMSFMNFPPVRRHV
jgi:hypothetical protein